MWKARIARAAFLALSILTLTVATAAAPPRLPLAVAGGTLRIAVVGDIGEGLTGIAAALRSENQRAALNAIIVTGDNLYPCGVSATPSPRWPKILDDLASVGVPVFPVLGNHDYGEPKSDGKNWTRCGGADPELEMRSASAHPKWFFPARAYTIASTVAEIGMVDTTPVALDFAQPFLGSSIAADITSEVPALFSGAAPWRIVVGHHSLYSSGYHGLFPRKERSKLRTLLLPAMRNAHVDLYICGHDHHLELIQTGKGTDRMIFLISGAASDPVPPVRLLPGSLYPNDARAYLGYAVLTITRNQLGVRFFDTHASARSELFTFQK